MPLAVNNIGGAVKAAAPANTYVGEAEAQDAGIGAAGKGVE
jgi:hypothetical protein